MLGLRERALKEKTQAELAWLEQKKNMSGEKGSKGKDDQYPSMAQIKKKKRGLVMKWQQERVRHSVVGGGELICQGKKKDWMAQNHDIMVSSHPVFLC